MVKNKLKKCEEYIMNKTAIKASNKWICCKTVIKKLKNVAQSQFYKEGGKRRHFYIVTKFHL